MTNLTLKELFSRVVNLIFICSGDHLTLNSHLWLQEAVACDSGHTPVNRSGWRAKPGEGSQLGLKPSGEPGCLHKHAKTGPGGVSKRERFSSNYHDPGFCGRERVGSSLCTGPTINLSCTGLSSACTLKSPAAMGEGRSSRWR